MTPIVTETMITQMPVKMDKIAPLHQEAYAVDALPIICLYPSDDFATLSINHGVATTALDETVTPIGHRLGVIVKIIRFASAIRTAEHRDEQDNGSSDDGKHKP